LISKESVRAKHDKNQLDAMRGVRWWDGMMLLKVM
jgi:hypothetical protein